MSISSKKSIESLIDERKKKINIRKNQFDITAALSYGLNVSLVHFTLFFMIIIFVRWPNIDQAALMDS